MKTLTQLIEPHQTAKRTRNIGLRFFVLECCAKSAWRILVLYNYFWIAFTCHRLQIHLDDKRITIFAYLCNGNFEHQQDMDYRKLKDDCVDWTRKWFEKNGPHCSAVIGMSGGKDSTVAAAICAEALGKERVIGVALPSNGQSVNEADEICKFIGIRYMCLNIGDIDSKFSELGKGSFSKQTLMNIPPRIRMTVLYAIAQSNNGMVANTCNLSEDYIGYATLFGDAAGSFSPLGKLCVREIRGIGHELGLPSKWVDKIPDDGLPGSCPDETKFGFTYETLDHYIREGICEDEEIKNKIDSMHIRNKFKTDIINIPSFVPSL